MKLTTTSQIWFLPKLEHIFKKWALQKSLRRAFFH
jgi:hypothetical protein